MELSHLTETSAATVRTEPNNELHQTTMELPTYTLDSISNDMDKYPTSSYRYPIIRCSRNGNVRLEYGDRLICCYDDRMEEEMRAIFKLILDVIYLLLTTRKSDTVSQWTPTERDAYYDEPPGSYGLCWKPVGYFKHCIKDIEHADPCDTGDDEDD